MYIYIYIYIYIYMGLPCVGRPYGWPTGWPVGCLPGLFVANAIECHLYWDSLVACPMAYFSGPETGKLKWVS